METTPKLQLIYDQDCPLCSWYSNLFVKYGFLQQSGRVAFRETDQRTQLEFDRQQAKNKIALLDNETQQASYGIDSLLKVIGSKLPRIEKVGKLLPVYWLLSLLYAFITYNRKAFAPSKCTGYCDCYPSRSYFWRSALILLAGLYVNNVTWIYFSRHLDPWFVGQTYWLDSIFYISQFGFLYVIFRLTGQQNFYDYAGQIAVISLIGAFALQLFHWGLTAIAALGIETGMLEPFCYGMVYLFMLYEHKRRCGILGIHWVMSISWILFRFAIYPFAFVL
ncbi:MAG: DCC1-like thiol-disulfide oxidoreductase family protein [Bacteroidota bacterium]